MGPGALCWEEKGLGHPADSEASIADKWLSAQLREELPVCLGRGDVSGLAAPQ